MSWTPTRRSLKRSNQGMPTGQKNTCLPIFAMWKKNWKLCEKTKKKNQRPKRRFDCLKKSHQQKGRSIELRLLLDQHYFWNQTNYRDLNESQAGTGQPSLLQLPCLPIRVARASVRILRMILFASIGKNSCKQFKQIPWLSPLEQLTQPILALHQLQIMIIAPHAPSRRLE